jgi:hypothetical protein
VREPAEIGSRLAKVSRPNLNSTILAILFIYRLFLDLIRK